MNVALALAALLEGSFAEFMAAVAGAGPSSVPERMSLANYLTTERRLPRWQQKLSVDHAIVDVERRAPDGSTTRVAEVRLETMLEAGDMVTLRDSDAAYGIALRAKAQSAVDYALLAAKDDNDHFLNFEKQLVEQTGARVLTDQDADPSASLEQFVVNVGQGSKSDLPIRDLHVISHAAYDFSLQFSLRPEGDSGAGEVSWETIEGAPHKLRVPDEYLLPAALRSSEPPRLFIRACEVGQAVPLLEKLRHAMNPRLRVHAPKHFLGARSAGPGLKDRFEYMCEVHWVPSRADLKRDEVLEQLRSRTRRDADGTVIPSAAWEVLVPTEPWDANRVRIGEIPLSFQMPPITRPDGSVQPAFAAAFPIGGMYRFRFDIAFAIPTSLTQAEFETNELEALRASIHAHPDPRSKDHPAHPLPQWKRLRFETVDDFVDGVVSPVSYRLDSTGARIEGRCSGVLYGVLLPVLASDIAPVDGRRTLAINYYPDGSKTPAVELMRLTDSKFWATVG